VDRRASSGAGTTPLAGWLGNADGNKDKKISMEEWEKFCAELKKEVAGDKPALYCVRLGGEGEVGESHVAWKESRGVPEVPSPLYYQDRLYCVRNGGIVHCREASTGREIYSERLGALGGYFASPVAGDDKIYFISDQGVVVVLSAGDRFNVLARNELGERVMATPALVDNIIYIRTATCLYAFAE
jgi:outer membrane protein assembly factor BamB